MHDIAKRDRSLPVVFRIFDVCLMGQVTEQYPVSILYIFVRQRFTLPIQRYPRSVWITAIAYIARMIPLVYSRMESARNMNVSQTCERKDYVCRAYTRGYNCVHDSTKLGFVSPWDDACLGRLNDRISRLPLHITNNHLHQMYIDLNV